MCVTFLSPYFSPAGVTATGCCQNFNFVAESTFNAGVSRLIIAVGICLLQNQNITLLLRAAHRNSMITHLHFSLKLLMALNKSHTCGTHWSCWQM